MEYIDYALLVEGHGILSSFLLRYVQYSRSRSYPTLRPSPRVLGADRSHHYAPDFVFMGTKDGSMARDAGARGGKGGATNGSSKHMHH